MRAAGGGAPHQSPAGLLHLPVRDLAAAGLALKLGLALAGRCGKPVDPSALLRVACLGTIADLVPLQGENRVIAALGLKALTEAKSQGLKALIQQSGMKPPYTAADVGFRIGPRINAAGRLQDPNAALELLMSRDVGRSQELAAELDTLNRERQATEKQVVDEARAMFAARAPLPPILMGWSPEWHKGVVGVAAGRIAKDFHRPTVLLAVEGEKATGSGRSIPGLELHGFLSSWKERMVRFGGHAQAVGLTVETGRLAELQGEWEAAGSAGRRSCWPGASSTSSTSRRARSRTACWCSWQRWSPSARGTPGRWCAPGRCACRESRELSAPATFRRGHGARTARWWSWWGGAGETARTACAERSRFSRVSRAMRIAGRCCGWWTPGRPHPKPLS